MNDQVAAASRRPMPLWWLALPVIAVILVTALAATDILARPAATVEAVTAGSVALGAPVPDFSTQDLGGASVKLSSFRGSPLLVSFWATWCTACREELPALQAVSMRQHGAPVAVLLVNYGESDRTRLKTYLSGLGVHLESALDPAGTIGRAYRVVGLPVILVVTPSGDLAYLHAGALGQADLEAALAPPA